MTEQQIVVIEETGPFSQRMRDSLPALVKKLNIPEATATQIISGLMVAYQNSEQREKFDNCTTQSVFNALHTCHSLQLPIDGRKLVHPIPYEVKVPGPGGKRVGSGKYEMQLQFGRGAYVNIMRREFKGAFITTGIIYKDDTFSRWKENGNDSYRHEVADPTRSDYGNMVGTYAYIKYFSNGEWFSRMEVAPRSDIDKARAMSGEGSKAWNNWMGEQAQKLPLKRLGKLTMEGLPAWEMMEAADNEIYDLEELPSGPKRSTKEEMEAALKRANEPEVTTIVHSENIIDVEHEVIEGDVEQPIEKPQEAQEATPAPIIAEKVEKAAPSAPVEDMGDIPDWDGRTVHMKDFEEVRDFANAVAAGMYLLGEMKKQSSVKTKRQMYDNNISLRKALATPRGMPVLDQITALVTKKEKPNEEQHQGDAKEEEGNGAVSGQEPVEANIGLAGEVLRDGAVSDDGQSGERGEPDHAGLPGGHHA